MVTARDRLDLAICAILAAAVIAIAAAVAYDAHGRHVGAGVSRAWLDEVKYRDVVRGGMGDGDS